MAIILITDTPQGGACRCEGQAQALDLSNLKPEQVEALKQALGINANASQGAGAVDFSALSPEQVEALKQVLGINANTSQGAGQVDFSALSPEQVEALKQVLGINANTSQGAGQVDFSALSPEQVEALKQALETSELYIPRLTRAILDEPIVMGSVFDNWETEFAEMNRVQVDGFGASSSAGVSEYIELLAKAVNRLVERVDRLEAGQ